MLGIRRHRNKHDGNRSGIRRCNPQHPMKTKRSFSTCIRALACTALASALLSSAAHSQAPGPVYSVHIVGFQKTFATNFYPPRTGGFFAENDTVFPGDTTTPGAVVRNFAVQFSKSVVPHGLSAQVVSSTGRCSGQISLDGGATFVGWTGACTGTLLLTPSSTAQIGRAHV